MFQNSVFKRKLFVKTALFFQGITFLKWANLIWFFLFVFLIFYFYSERFIFWTIFTQKGILRSIGWLEGQPYWPGPEMTIGGSLPGPFFYFLLFPALIFGNNPYSQTILWCMTWISLTYSAAFYFATKVYSHRTSLVIFLSCFIGMLGFGIFQPLSYSHSAGFAVLFHTLALISLYQWRATSKNVYLYLTSLIVGLGTQVHILLSSHIITAFLFCMSEKKLKLFLLFCFYILLILSPYYLISWIGIFQTSSLSLDSLIALVNQQSFFKKIVWEY